MFERALCLQAVALVSPLACCIRLYIYMTALPGAGDAAARLLWCHTDVSFTPFKSPCLPYRGVRGFLETPVSLPTLAVFTKLNLIRSLKMSVSGRVVPSATYTYAVLLGQLRQLASAAGPAMACVKLVSNLGLGSYEVNSNYLNSLGGARKSLGPPRS